MFVLNNEFTSHVLQLQQLNQMQKKKKIRCELSSFPSSTKYKDRTTRTYFHTNKESNTTYAMVSYALQENRGKTDRFTGFKSIGKY